ncbi:DEAD/DEAH box helicase [Thalassobellus suaedae]|uniref:DNA 3'-5' helicase II n=1 Tax=Thalassobellus suaedae TaxID=3074124 RepID=A0ABY9XXQ4_9FLAO|nr:ATP-binding domain-containing protein [Flavobacteriaceae bacterium HL-DH14]
MIEKNINESLLKNDPSAVSLIRYLHELDAELSFLDSAIYHQFPIYPEADSDSTVSANVLFISKTHGLFIFQCLNKLRGVEIQLEEHEDDLAEIDTMIYAKLLKDSPKLKKDRRNLKLDINSSIFINDEDSEDVYQSEFNILNSKHDVKVLIDSAYDENLLTDSEFKDLKATLEGSKVIVKPKKRGLKDAKDFKNSKGAILSHIENEISNFDSEQKRAALFIVDGAQRIRGLAGSGKTIILAMKAAMIHLNQPEANILYTYYTKNLNDVVKRYITKFYRQFADRDPDWEKINIMHAWGGQRLEGVYYNACKLNNVASINLTEARRMSRLDPFEVVCEDLIKNKLKKQYDYSLIDEAQDFPPQFYRLCRKITEKNRVVWAYDDFQNILNIDLQDEKETFGKDENDEYYVDFSKAKDDLRDLILHTCYRTPRKSLITAFSLGLGVYNNNESDEIQMIQRLESNEHWESLGFEVVSGDSENGSEMIIDRPNSNSSSIKNELLGSDEILKVFKADGRKEEIEFVIDSIKSDLAKEMCPEDISVICMDNRNARDFFKYLEERLDEEDIKSFNLFNAPTTNKSYKVPDHVTLSTIYNAKGNESGSIYIIGIDTVFRDKDNIVERNKIFTAMTRSLAWVTLSGVGGSVQHCIDEIELLKKNNYQMHFVQPSEDDVKTIRQGISSRQKLLNDFERFAQKKSEETGLAKEEVVKQLKIDWEKENSKKDDSFEL